MTKGTIAKKTIESIFSNIEKEEIETKECLEALVECELAPKGAITWLTQRAQIKQVKSLFQQHMACATNNGYQLLKDKPDIPDDAYCYKNFNGYRDITIKHIAHSSFGTSKTGAKIHSIRKKLHWGRQMKLQFDSLPTQMKRWITTAQQNVLRRFTMSTSSDPDAEEKGPADITIAAVEQTTDVEFNKPETRHRFLVISYFFITNYSSNNLSALIPLGSMRWT